MIYFIELITCFAVLNFLVMPILYATCPEVYRGMNWVRLKIANWMKKYIYGRMDIP